MKTLTRDLTAAAGLAAAVLVSLMIVRVTASEPALTTRRNNDNGLRHRLRHRRPPSRRHDLNSSSTADPLPAARPLGTAPPQQPPARASATLVLSSGAPVNPRLDRTPRTARPASTASVTVALTATTGQPGPAGVPGSCRGRGGVAVRVVLVRLPSWSRRQHPPRRRLRGHPRCRRVRTRGRSTTGPGPRSPQPKRVPPAPTSPPPWRWLSRNGSDETTVTLTATQVLSAAGTAYQSVPIDLTRIVQRDPAGHWRIGRPVTAN